ncbi:MAG: hypothetical protein RJB26_2008 [Pseudomonadota bacterium]
MLQIRVSPFAASLCLLVGGLVAAPAFGAGSSPGKTKADEVPVATGTELDATLPVEVESTGRKEVGNSGDGWYARYLRAPQTVECLGQAGSQCREQRLEVTSDAKTDLICKTLVPMADGTNDERSVMLTAGRTKTIAEAFLPADQTLKLRTVTCQTLPTAPALDPAPPAGCRPEITAGPGVEAFYPDLSRKLGEEGPVTVYFRLEQAEGQATAIQVGQSSLSAQLDEAAMLYIANQTFKVACPAHQFRLRVRFKLQEEVPAP